MQPVQVPVVSHTLEPLGHPSLVLQLPEPSGIRTGQFVLVYDAQEQAAVRTRLFPVAISQEQIVFDRVPAPGWLPGKMLDVLGPMGNTFSPPASSRNWLMLSLGTHPERLLPLLDAGHTRSAALAFWSAFHMPGLAADVERPVSPEEAVDWADFIAIEYDGPAWPEAYRSLSIDYLRRKRAPIQVLVDVPTPCGLGGCQACAIPIRKGYFLGCQEGLVRSFEEIDV